MTEANLDDAGGGSGGTGGAGVGPRPWPRWVVWVLAGVGGALAGFAAVVWLHMRQAHQDVAQAQQDIRHGAYSAARSELEAAVAEWPLPSATIDMQQVDRLQRQLEASNAAFAHGESAWQQGQWAVASQEFGLVSPQNSHHAEAARELALLAQARSEGQAVSAVEGAYSQLSGSMATFWSQYNTTIHAANHVWTLAQSSGYTYSFSSVSGNATFITAVAGAASAQNQLTQDANAVSSAVTSLSETLGVLQSQPSLTNGSLATLLRAASGVSSQADAISQDIANEVSQFNAITSGNYTGGVPAYISATNSSLTVLESTENALSPAEAAAVGFEEGALGKLLGTSTNVTALISSSG